MKVAFYTLGCKVNQYETQAMETLFIKDGFEVVPFSDTADVYIINTCTVTALSDKKSRNAARRSKIKNPSSVLIVCGCYAQVEPEEVKKLCNADIVVGSTQKGDVLTLAKQALNGITPVSCLAPIKGRVKFEHLPPGGLIGRTRALLKVQDGCQNFCSYCKIPYARGVCRSLDLENAVNDAKSIFLNGYKELVITGIEISSYGIDLPDRPTLSQLIYDVCQNVPHVRVRLGSLEPRTITEDFISAIKPLENLCHHFHLSLQSGCDATLKDMNRKYDTDRYFQSVSMLKAAFPECSVTTDLIVGFPGETEDNFNDSISFIQKCRLFKVHIFPYSRRKGTKAYDMPSQLNKSVKEDRAKKALSCALSMEKEYLNSKIGETLSVLFEQPDKDGFTGLSKEYCPVFAIGNNLHNKVCDVKITSVLNDTLIGEII